MGGHACNFTRMGDITLMDTVTYVKINKKNMVYFLPRIFEYSTHLKLFCLSVLL